MNRKEFIRFGSFTSASLTMQHTGFSTFIHASNEKAIKPLAITMWDFSWLERRWPGAGYEDWAKVLNELLVRGYNAVRIDAYPHLVANDANTEYTILQF